MLSFIRTHKIAVGVSSTVVLAGLAWLAFGFFGVHTLFIDDVVSEAAPTFDAPAVEAESASIAEPATSTTTAVDEAPSTDTPTTDPAADLEAAEPATPATETSDPDTGDEAVAPATGDVAEDPATAEPDTPPNEIVSELTGTFESEAHPTTGIATVLGNGTGQRFLRFEGFETDNGPDLNVYLFDDDTGEFIDLGDLKGNIGDQNYEISEDVDLERFDRVSIWCVRFGVGFGSAELMTA